MVTPPPGGDGSGAFSPCTLLRSAWVTEEKKTDGGEGVRRRRNRKCARLSEKLNKEEDSFLAGSNEVFKCQPGSPLAYLKAHFLSLLRCLVKNY